MIYYRYYRRMFRRWLRRLGWGTLHWWLLLFSAMMLVKLGIVAFLWLGGINIWLESLPVSAWLLGMVAAVALTYLTLTPAILWERRRLHRLVLAAKCDRTQIEWIVATALHTPRPAPITDPSRIMPEYSSLVDAVLLLTQNPTPGGVCLHCGAYHPDLATDARRYDPELHGQKTWGNGTATPCPVPKARALALKAQRRISASKN